VEAAGVSGAGAAGFGAGAFLAFNCIENYSYDMSLAIIDNKTVPVQMNAYFCITRLLF